MWKSEKSNYELFNEKIIENKHKLIKTTRT